MNGMSTNLTWTRTIGLVSTGSHEHQRRIGASGGPDGRGLDDLRPARPGPVRPAVRPGRPAGCGLAAAGLGGRDPAGRRPAPAQAVPPPDPARDRRPRRGDRRGDHVLHGGHRPAAARHRQRAGIPGPARRGRRPRPGRPAAAVAGARRGRRPAADPPVAGRRQPGRCRVCPRRGGLLGRLHRAHPDGRGRGRGAAGTGRVHSRGRPGGHRGIGTGRDPGADAASAARGSRPGAAVARGAVQPGDVRAAAADHGGVRDPDVPGARARPARRARAARPGAPGLVAGRGGLRRGRGHRLRADRRPLGSSCSCRHNPGRWRWWAAASTCRS